jgi:hypothetical protein
MSRRRTSEEDFEESPFYCRSHGYCRREGPKETRHSPDKLAPGSQENTVR